MPWFFIFNGKCYFLQVIKPHKTDSTLRRNDLGGIERKGRMNDDIIKLFKMKIINKIILTHQHQAVQK